MSTKRASLLVAVLSAVLVLVLTMAAAERKSPGRVSTVHGRIAELEGGEACSMCHGGWFGSMRAACNECHTEIAEQLEQNKGLHGLMADDIGSACSTCHIEHHGDDFQLVNRLAFAQAGVLDPQEFDHQLVGFTLAGVHTELGCAECHEHADVAVLPEGAKRYLGLSRDCASCHADPHGGRMQLGCAACHTQTTFTSRVVPEHERWLSLDGVHSDVGCRGCHEAGTANALEALRPGSHREGRQCGDCHAAPHAERFLAGNAAADGVAIDAGCASCHWLMHESFADLAVTLTPAQHAYTGFPLAEPHGGIACAKCHAPERPYAERHPGRTANDCRACHADPHGGQFDAGPFAADGCVGCHGRTRFEPHEFDLADHRRTAMPLEQRCEACHVEPAAGEPRRFRGTPSRCEQCHQDAHLGAFEHFQLVFDAQPRGACAECHDTEAWSNIEHARFDHRDWTGFALDGAHGQIGCTDCHARAAEPDQYGRRFGRIPEHQDGAAECVRCHGDPHEGIFDRDGVPTEVDGRTGCRRCHDTASFRALPFGFDHTGFSQFSLLGKHAELDCSACHEPLAAASDTGRTWGRAKGRNCANCHADPHQGQFEKRGETDCMRCHKSTTSFATLSFRHNLDSRFPLGDQHAKVACKSCHKEETEDGVTFARYKPLPTTCVECHGREEGGSPFRRRRK